MAKTPAHAHHAELFNPDGSPRFTNALIRETSPYLLQHAHNPVDWHAWGPGAFEKARKLDRPIFLSIGYSTCYWCHVMERQCFENPAIAAQMNQQFVNIKVDREERPDIDDIYMLAVQVMTGHGGWPMSVFLTPPGGEGPDDPGLRPFYAGTYFPPEPMHGRASFPQVLQAISDAWRKQRAEALAQSHQIADAVAEHLGRLEEAGELSIDMVSSAAGRLLRSYDAEHGGFGGAPKFPTPSNLFLLLEVFANNPREDLWEALANTFDHMARGGMYDQIGGGFHRYSTDEKWLVPHFEKMLYDNGQLIEAYLTAQAIRPDVHEPGLYTRVVRQTCDYVLREMTDASGAFWSAQDAEVDGLEGGNYLWRPPEIAAAIEDPALAQLAMTMYGLNLGPNFQDPHHPKAPPGNVLYLPKRLNELAAQEGMTLEALLAAKQRIDALLLATRGQRKQPGTDDKVLTAWNGMMIAGLARAGAELQEPKYREAAVLAARAILDLMRTPDGGLFRSMCKGQARIPAFLDDYAFFIHGLIELHRADRDPWWIETARKIMAAAQEKFSAPAGKGGYFDTLADQPDLFVRARSVYDGAIPSANSQMVHNLIDLYQITAEERYLDRAMLDLRSFARAMRRHGSGMARMHQALLRAMEAAPQRFAGQPSTARLDDRPQVLALEIDTDRVNLASGSGAVALTLRIGPEYHLNAHEPGVKGVIPTLLELLDAPGLELAVSYPEGVTREFPFAAEPIRIYEGQVRIEATLRRAGPQAPPAQATLALNYQVCTEMSCLEPQRAEIPLRIEAGS